MRAMYLGFAVLVLLSLFAPAGALKKSSHDCQGDQPLLRTCHFRNVCVKNGQFYYITPSKSPRPFQHGESVVTLGTYSSHPSLSFQMADPSELPSNPSWFSSPTLLYFAPSSMYYHFLLDDTLGLFWMIKNHGLKEEELQILIEGEPSTLVEIWRGVFTKKEIRTVSSLSYNQLACFDDLYAGPASHNFGGPGRSQVTQSLILPMRNLFLEKFIQDSRPPQLPVITIIKRSTSRLLLNEEDLIDELSTIQGIHIQSVVLESLPFQEQLTILQNTTILLGIHGSGLANIIFLPLFASVLEIFPYQFHRPSYQDLAKPVLVNYLSWTNDDPERTHFHPEMLEGFHLSQEDQQMIFNQPIYTSSWAANIYWVNQDTEVDTEAVKEKVLDFLEQDGSLNSILHERVLLEKFGRRRVKRNEVIENVFHHL